MEEKKNEFMSSDEVAALLVQLFADYKSYASDCNDDCKNDYAKAVGIVIRMLSD